jgi:hypothetical protein
MIPDLWMLDIGHQTASRHRFSLSKEHLIHAYIGR